MTTAIRPGEDVMTKRWLRERAAEVPAEQHERSAKLRQACKLARKALAT